MNAFGGVARVATKIKELRDSLTAAGENVIVLDAGDQFQGSLMYTTYKGAVEAEFMEAIGFDAMALGNHEFDDGPEGLGSFLDKVTFPVISGNLDVSQSNVLAGRVGNHVVLEVGGEKIGIISALAMDTPETSSPGNSVIFQDDIDSLKADVATLEAEGRDQDHRADPCGIAARSGDCGGRAGGGCGGGGAFAYLPFGDRSGRGMAPIRPG